MITNFILGLITDIISTVDSWLPHFTLPAFFSGGSIIPQSVIDFIAASLVAAQGFMPSGLIAGTLYGLSLIWPLVLAFYVFNWIYRHIPTIAGFGLNS